MSNPARIIVLAAQRRGVVDPLAARFGVSHKCLIPLHDEPLIAHVMRTVTSHPGIASVAVSVEEEAFAAVQAALVDRGLGDVPVIWCPSADNLADSVRAAATGHEGPLVITTADNALLRAASVDAMLVALGGADVGIAMAIREAVWAAHPEGQRRFYEFRDGGFSNCNLYGLAGVHALAAAEVFRGGGQFAKKASRIIDAFGLFNLLLLRCKLLTLGGGMKRISRRIGLRIAPVVLADGSQAIDVDNDRTYGVVDQLMTARKNPSHL